MALNGIFKFLKKIVFKKVLKKFYKSFKKQKKLKKLKKFKKLKKLGLGLGLVLGAANLLL